MYLIVGLGNPGKEYEKTKHNTGYMAVDYIANKLNCDIKKDKFNGLYIKTKIEDEDVILLKPTTYMNLSGEAIVQYLNYFDIPAENLIVIYDDKDIDFGTIKIKSNGSAGTHNGMKSIVQCIGTIYFPRIRIGINLETNIEDLADYVLSNYTKEQLNELSKIYGEVYLAVIEILKGNIDIAMNKYN